MQQFKAGRITGFEIDAAAVVHARSRLAGFANVSLDLAQADQRTITEHCDRVLALNFAYHFASRINFFAMAASTLHPGGVLALTDIGLADGAHSADYAWLAKTCGISPGARGVALITAGDLKISATAVIAAWLGRNK